MKGKQRAAAGFAAFLIFMAVCTVTARGLYASGLPRVTILFPERKNITHEVKVQGNIRQGQEFGVYALAGLRVGEVLVKNGDTFSQGDPLFRIDPDDLENIISEKELELAKLKNQLKGASGTQKTDREGQNVALSRAQEDYDRTLRDADLLVSRKRLTLTQAQKELEDYKKYLETFPDGPVSSGNSPSGQEGREKLGQLEQAVISAAQAVEDALLARQDQLKEAERKIEDARLAVGDNPASDAQNIGLEADYLRERLKEYKELRDADGWIRAKEAGRVTAQKLSVGERTKDSACLLYARDDGQRIVEVALTKEQAEYVSLGDKAELAFQDRTGALARQEAVVDYLENTQDGGVLARLELADTQAQIGQNVEIKFTRQSEAYESCIPRNALYSDGKGGYFVYTVKEQEGILGMEWHIEKASVTLLDQNERFAAVESAVISQDSRIVGTLDKEAAQGDVVRIVDE